MLLKVSHQELQSINMFDDYVFDSSKLNTKNINYFKKILQLCEKKKMRIIVVTCPIPMASYLKIKNPGAIDNYFKKLFAKYHVEYYNYLNRASVGFNSDSMYFSDFHHLNNMGATIMSKIISAIINRTGNYKLPICDGKM